MSVEKDLQSLTSIQQPCKADVSEHLKGGGIMHSWELRKNVIIGNRLIIGFCFSYCALHIALSFFIWYLNRFDGKREQGPTQCHGVCNLHSFLTLEKVFKFSYSALPFCCISNPIMLGDFQGDTPKMHAGQLCARTLSTFKPVFVTGSRMCVCILEQ